jgi:hypothetical protein
VALEELTLCADRLEKVEKTCEDEKRSRILLAEHLEEANMNVSRLAGLIRAAEMAKQDLTVKCEAYEKGEREHEKAREEFERVLEGKKETAEEATRKLEEIEKDLARERSDGSEMKMDKQKVRARIFLLCGRVCVANSFFARSLAR